MNDFHINLCGKNWHTMSTLLIEASCRFGNCKSEPFVTGKWRAFLQTALVLTIFRKSQINFGLGHIPKVPDKCSKRSMSLKQEII